MSQRAGSPITPEQLSALPPDFQALLRSVIEHYEAQLTALKAEIAELKAENARLKKTPQNSSLPHSSKHPHAKPAAKKPKSKRRRGAQPGHAKCERPLLPSDEVRTVKPSECRRCGTRLVGGDPAPLRHQVWELPEVKPLVTEYQRHRLTCSCCGEQTCAALPSGVPVGQSGPRLIAFSALLMAYFRQSQVGSAVRTDDSWVPNSMLND